MSEVLLYAEPEISAVVLCDEETMLGEAEHCRSLALGVFPRVPPARNTRDCVKSLRSQPRVE